MRGVRSCVRKCAAPPGLALFVVQNSRKDTRIRAFSSGAISFKVHDVCRECVDEKCDLGANRVSILPPSAIRAWDASTRGRAEVPVPIAT